MDDEAVEAIEKELVERGYHRVRAVGQGSYGTVLSAVTNDLEKVAIKVILEEQSWTVEEELWSELHHENILPVLRVIALDSLTLKLYVTPFHPQTLENVTQTDDFKFRRDGLQKIKKWYTEVLQGLNYLHEEGFCHMDIKSDNVLISGEGTAILCDFSGLNLTSFKVTRSVVRRPNSRPTFSAASVFKRRISLQNKSVLEGGGGGKRTSILLLMGTIDGS